jgi:uroporphyrinogen III methyltransferase/synthase
MSGLPGTVYLVGAGPGDPELLTLKARRLLAGADVVVHDNLVSQEILALARPDGERIFVGKKGGHISRPQSDIDAILVAKAREGKSVVRLKGGDPLVFGRGGEEAEILTSEGISFEIVPGVTAAIAAGAYSGIPLTHRAHASAVVFLTGHEDPSKPDALIRWEDYARLGATLCIYMSMQNLVSILRRLLEGGLPPSTPAAIVQEATTEAHRFLLADAETLAARAAAQGFASPSIVIVGEVAASSERLSWFEPARPMAVGTRRR